jgi:hypothetical protein
MRLLIAAGALLAVLQTPAAAFIGRVHNAPWCVNYVYLENIVDCAYYSLEECEAARSGVGGYCSENLRRPHVEEERRGPRRSYR